MPGISWPAITWMLNLLVLIGLGLGTAVVLVLLLYVVRFFRWENIKKAWSAELPSFREVAATLKIFGQEIAANAKLDTERDRQLGALEDRVDRLESSIRAEQEVAKALVAHLRQLENPDG